MSRKHIGYLIALLALGSIYAIKFGSSSDVASNSTDTIRQYNLDLRTDIKLIYKAQVKDDLRKHALIKVTNEYWQSASGTLPEKILQERILKFASDCHLPLTDTSALRLSRRGDYIDAYDIVISATGSIDKISAFIRQVDNCQPRLTWKYSNIRPTNINKPVKLQFNATIRAYVLKTGSMQKTGKVEK